MLPESFFHDLQDHFSETECQTILTALRQDPVVWDSLQKEEFFRTALTMAGSDVHAWCPANLALIWLQIPEKLADLRSYPLIPLDAELRQQIVDSYEDFIRSGMAPRSLGEAGMVALALRERRRLTDTWKGIQSEMQGSCLSSPSNLFAVWRTPLAILFGLAADPIELLQEFAPEELSSSDLAGVDLVINTLSSNPLSTTDQANFLIRMIAAYSADEQIIWLERLSDTCQPELVTQVAGRLLQKEETGAKTALLDFDHGYRSTPLTAIPQFRLGSFYQFAGSPGMSIPLLIETQQALRRIQAHVARQLADASQTNGDYSQAIRSRHEVVELENSAPSACVELAETLLQSGQVDAAGEALPADCMEPRAMIAKARVAVAAGDIAQAQAFSQTVLNNLHNKAKSVVTSDLDPATQTAFAQTLLAAGLADEAVQAVQALASARPNDPEIIHLLAQAHQVGGQLDQAIEAASLAVMLQPDNLEIRRSLAGGYEKAGNWQQALKVRKEIETRSEEVAASDWVALACCANQAAQTGEAARAASAALAMDPDCGPAHAALAEAKYMQGDKDAAVEQYIQGTLADPEDAASWMGLSNLYKTQGDENQALATLREAVLAAPRTAEIHFILGETLISNGSPSEAITCYRHAADLDPKSCRFALRLAGVLEDLGHLTEARQVLERTRLYWPNHPELAYAHGKVLLGLGETLSAVSPLRVKLYAQPTEIAPYLLYARAMAMVSTDNPLGASSRSDAKQITGINPLDDARRALEKALEIDPDSLEARVLLAENLSYAGMSDESQDIFLTLSETLSAEHQPWNGRIKLGLGSTSLALGQTDAAIAALQEAATEMPNHLPAQQALAEAYLIAGLKQEAYQTAQDALRLYPTNVQNLVWYAGLTYTLGIYPESIATLERAAELSQNPAELYLKIAQVHLRAENIASAKSAVEALMAIDRATPAEYQQAAHAWLSMNEPDKAIHCLEQAIAIAPDADLSFELARLNNLLDRPEEALCRLHESLDDKPDQRRVFTAEAEILAKTGRVQDALVSLEMALRMPDELNSGTESKVIAKRVSIPQVTKPAYPRVAADTAHIHLQIASILRKTGQISAALEHGARAVELEPGDPEIAAIAVDLAFCNLDLGIAVALADPAIDALSGQSSTYGGSDGDVTLSPSAAVLLCGRAEIAIENEQVDLAARFAAQAHAFCPNHPRVFAVQARLAALTGDYPLGEQLYEAAINRLSELTSPAQGSERTENKEAFLTARGLTPTDSLVFGYPTLSLAQTALDLHHWEEGIQLFAQAAKNTPDEPRSHLFLARALVLSAESQRTLAAVKVVHHLPGADKLSETNAKLFEKAVQAASKLSSAKEIARWRTRGYAAFNPDPRNAELLNQLPPNADDAAAQASIALYMHQSAQAKEIVKPFASHPKALIQLALASQAENPAEGFFAARSLAGAQPANPVSQATLAILANEVEEYDIARDAIEKALEIWPNEPEWHALAAEMNRHTGEFERSIQHQTRAYELDRSNPAYTMALGKSYLRAGKSNEAAHLFEEATCQAPSSVDAWLWLAKANAEFGDLTAAIASTEKAITIAPEDIQPVLLCGEYALKAGQIELARQRAICAAAMDPGEAQAPLLLVYALENQGQHEEALNTIENTLDQVRDPFALQLERVSLVRKLRGAESALGLLHSLSEQYRDEPAILTLFAEALVEAGQREAAQQAAQSALQLQPDQPSMHLMVGRLQRTSGQLDQAIHHLTEAIRLSPREIEAYLELGRVYHDRREYIQAVNAYKAAMQVNIRDPRAYYQAGISLKETKDYSNAEKMLRRAADLAPDDINIRRQLGAIIALNLVRNLQEAS